MHQKKSSTIVALSTPLGFSGIAVVRLTGDKSLQILRHNFSNYNKIKPNRAVVGKIRDGESLLDNVVVIFYKSPNSYTGEDLIEICCHGSPYITERLIDLCIKAGARLAEPGEFTKISFLNGKMDLSQAEGIADLIYSRTKAAHKASVGLLEGKTGRAITNCRTDLINITALLELELDFSENDIDFTPNSTIVRDLEKTYTQTIELIESYRFGKLISQGVIVPLVGPPNSGKSSLLNAFLQEERAIVSKFPGTTRDTIEESFQRDGLQFRLVDTAGLRKTDDAIEILSIQRTLDNIKKSDLILFVIDAALPDYDYKPYFPDVTKHKIIVINKVDVAENRQIASIRKRFPKQVISTVSAKNHTGIHELADLMVSNIKHRAPKSETEIITKKRHRDSLISSRNAIRRAIRSLNDGLPSEYIIVDLRVAIAALDEILGKTTTDDILNKIFSNFCIGK